MLLPIAKGDCQHISGGGHLPQVGVARDGLTHKGPIQTYTQKSDSGNDLSFSFCGTCGSPLFKSTSMAADMVFLCAGALNEAPELSFDKKVFEDCRQAWDKD